MKYIKDTEHCDSYCTETKIQLTDIVCDNVPQWLL